MAKDDAQKMQQGMKVGKGRQAGKKVRGGSFTHEGSFDVDQHDCGPWIEVTSSRVDSIRYDYQNRSVQVLWANKPQSRGYVYRDVPYERFRAFVRASSKGKYINSAMNGYDYDQMTPDELNAPTNDQRSAHGGPQR
jgi:arginine/ornithine N-succinyltransferase beta subunit